MAEGVGLASEVVKAGFVMSTEGVYLALLASEVGEAMRMVERVGLALPASKIVDSTSIPVSNSSSRQRPGVGVAVESGNSLDDNAPRIRFTCSSCKAEVARERDRTAHG